MYVVYGKCLTVIRIKLGRKPGSLSAISIYTLSDLGDLSNPIGSLSRTIQH